MEVSKWIIYFADTSFVVVLGHPHGLHELGELFYTA